MCPPPLGEIGLTYLPKTGGGEGWGACDSPGFRVRDSSLLQLQAILLRNSFFQCLDLMLIQGNHSTLEMEKKRKSIREQRTSLSYKPVQFRIYLTGAHPQSKKCFFYQMTNHEISISDGQCSIISQIATSISVKVLHTQHECRSGETSIAPTAQDECITKKALILTLYATKHNSTMLQHDQS